jgi:hypothetical protein
MQEGSLLISSMGMGDLATEERKGLMIMAHLRLKGEEGGLGDTGADFEE